MDLQTSKNLGGIGALLLFIGPLVSWLHPFAGLLGIIGFILVLIALKGLSDYYNEGSIFNNALYGFITSIVGAVVSVGIFIGTALVALADLGISDWTDPAQWTETFTGDFTGEALNAIFSLLGAAVIAFVVLFIFVVITVWLYRKSLGALATKSGVGLFGTTGLILLIGGILTIIGIGLILIWIAFLLLTIAFFQLKPTATEPAPPPPPS
ncbi:MAG: DUF996 domain-containing protein [Candidatus Bathyarchaeota archaeon]|nr:MAG: DUF996 domain-containing protein [Candidatus Bathyarchaeota archaeon]